jgi:gas vesicle protein
MSKDSENSQVVWFLAGAAIGATVALLFAPASGKETRRRIARKASEGREYVEDVAGDIADKGREYYEKGQRLADEAAEMFERGRKMVKG